MSLDPVVAYLRSPQSIRTRCGLVLDLAEEERLPSFRFHRHLLDAVADYVLEITQSNYPDGTIPFHSRWRHFEGGGQDRLGALRQQLHHLDPREQTRSLWDLAIVSVLLDAGAGAQWQYHEPKTGVTYSRSEGLAVASFDLFCSGAFSSDPQFPFQADALGLQNLTPSVLAQGLQVSPKNPLVGLPGRLSLLQRLGQVVGSSPVFQPPTGIPRPGHLLDYVLVGSVLGYPADSKTQSNSAQAAYRVSAHAVLDAVLLGLGEIWPGRITWGGVNLGDVWPYTPLTRRNDPTDHWIPFHKLSQWLTYSLLEPLQSLGIQITDLDQLTGLPEYRNGGLCLDMGLLSLKNPELALQSHSVGDDLIVEWRALTLCCLDLIAANIRSKLGLSVEALPLVKILQGGTWAAGRAIAARLRPDGSPPLLLNSDGTVF